MAKKATESATKRHGSRSSACLAVREALGRRRRGWEVSMAAEFARHASARVSDAIWEFKEAKRVGGNEK